MKFIYSLTMLSFLFLTACSTVKMNVNNLADHQYQVVTTSKKGGDALLDAINKAAAVCENQGKRLIVTSIESNYKGVQVPAGYTYETEVKFTCGPRLLDSKGKQK